MIVWPITQLNSGTNFDFGRCLWVPATPANAAEIPKNAATDFGTGDFTIAGWVYVPDTLTDNNFNLLYKSVTFDQFIQLRLDVSTSAFNSKRQFRLFFGARNNGGSSAVSFFSQKYMQLNAWNFVSVRRSAGTYYYVANAGTDTQVGQPMPNATINLPWSLAPSTGLYVDSLGFFNRCLTTDEVSYLYNGGSGNDMADLSNCVANYRFDDPAGNAALASPNNRFLDSSASNVPGILTGYTSGAKDFVSHYSLQ